jgi:serine/threonine-protein kinase
MIALPLLRLPGVLILAAAALLVALVALAIAALSLSGRPAVSVKAPSSAATPSLVVVPDVLGSTPAVATQQLEAQGLHVSLESEPSTNVPVGQIVSEAPVPGSRMQVASTVTLYSSAGP